MCLLVIFLVMETSVSEEELQRGKEIEKKQVEIIRKIFLKEMH